MKVGYKQIASFAELADNTPFILQNKATGQYLNCHSIEKADGSTYDRVRLTDSPTVLTKWEYMGTDDGGATLYHFGKYNEGGSPVAFMAELKAGVTNDFRYINTPSAHRWYVGDLPAGYVRIWYNRAWVWDGNPVTYFNDDTNEGALLLLNGEAKDATGALIESQQWLIGVPDPSSGTIYPPLGVISDATSFLFGSAPADYTFDEVNIHTNEQGDLCGIVWQHKHDSGKVARDQIGDINTGHHEFELGQNTLRSITVGYAIDQEQGTVYVSNVQLTMSDGVALAKVGGAEVQTMALALPGYHIVGLRGHYDEANQRFINLSGVFHKD